MFSLIILIGLIILIIGAPLAVGSVYTITYSAIEIIVFSLLLLHICFPRSPVPNSKFSILNSKLFFLLLPIFLFLLIALLQIVPIPLSVIKVVSPSTAALYEKLGLTLNTQHATRNTFANIFLLSLSLYSSTIAILKWFAYVGVFILITTFNPPEKKLKDGNWLKIISIAFFVIGFAEAIYGLYLYLNHSDSLLWFTRIYYKGFVDGTYINKNHLAGFMNMCIFISIGFLTSYIGSYRKKGYRLKETFLLILTTKKTIFIYLIIFGLLTMILAVIFSNSRMGQFSLIAGSIFLCILYTVKRLKNFLFILIFIFCMATAWGIWKGVEPVIERWNATDADFIGRNDVWKSTLKMSRDFPILGTGLGTYELAFPPFKPEKIGVGIVDHAHNDYLEMLSEVGWAGFVCWLSFFFMYLYFTISAWIQKQGAFSRGMGAGGIAATIATLIHSLADFNLQIPANALLLFIVMAITWQAVHTSFST